MPDLFDYDVFLSFSSKDEEVVKPIWQEFSQSGLRVFWSDETLKQNVGQSFFDVIQESLVNSRHLVVMMSANAAESEWVKLEYKTFFNECFLPAKGERRLIVYPIRDYDTTRLPPFLKNLQLARSAKALIPLLGGVDIRALRRENAELREQLAAANDELQRLRQETDSELAQLRKATDDELQKLRDEAAGLRRLNADIIHKLGDADQQIRDLQADAVKAPPREKVESQPSQSSSAQNLHDATVLELMKIFGDKSSAQPEGAQPPVVALMPTRGQQSEVKIGRVTNYFAKAGVAVVSLDDELRFGDKIRIKGHTTDFEQPVRSLRVGDKLVMTAPIGEVSFKTASRCRKGDFVYRVG